MKELRFHGEAIVTGTNSLNYIESLNIKKAFIATGEGSTFKFGTIDKIKAILDKKQCEYFIYSGIKKNPDTDAVLAGLSKMREFQPDTIIGVGGGSAIDAAKVMALFYDYPDLSFERAMNEALPEKRKTIRFVAIPTTSGTGTEVTRSAVITYKEQNIKIGLKSQAFIPDIAILDGELTLTMPQNIVAETGMDAMTHAVECFINKNVDDFTECLAAGAVEGLFKYLPASYANGDTVSREKVHNYQCMAGSAFANVGLGMAHGIAHSIGGMFDTGHGLINAIVLPYVLKYNSTDAEVHSKLQYLAKRVDKNDFIEAIKELNAQLNIPYSLEEMGMTVDDFDKNIDILAENSLKGSTRVNPVSITKDAMKKLLKNIFYGI